MGHLLKQARRRKGDTAVVAAKKLHCTPVTLSHWENGRTTPILSQWRRIAQYCGITIQKLSKIIDEDN